MKLLRILPIIGIILFLYLIYNIGIGNITQAFSSINKTLLILSLIIFIPRSLLQTYKWYMILKKQEIHLPFFFVYKTYFIGIFYGAVTPGWLGTFIRIPYIKNKAKISLGKSTSNIVIDSALDLIGIFILCTTGSILIYAYFPNLLPIIAGVFLIIIILILFFINRQRTDKFYQFFFKILIPQKYKKQIDKQLNEFYRDIPKIRQLTIPLILTLLSLILVYTQIYIIALALDINMPYVYVILVYPLVFLVELIPITISGLGTRETTLMGLFAILASNITETQIITMSIMGYFVTSLLPALVGSGLSLTKIGKK